MKEDEFEAKKELLKGLFMRYSSLINNRSGQEKDMVMKNIDVILAVSYTHLTLPTKA